MVAEHVPTGQPVHKISIIPRGVSALGFTLQLPVEEKFLSTEDELKDQLTILLGGRISEEIVLGSISTGAQNDLQRATDIAGVSGVPILVISLWDEKFSQRTRKNLKKLTVASVGSLFLVQGREQLESAADRFGRYLDGGYSIRYQVPAGTGDAALPVTVSTDDRTIEVIAPKSVR